MGRALTARAAGHTTERMTNVHSFSARTIDGTERSLGDYAGKVLLIVNVASKCGLTPQYTALEKLFKEQHAAGLEVLGISLVTNAAAGISENPLSHEEVIEAGQAAAARCGQLLSGIVRAL